MDKEVREPKQKRSIEKKEKILGTALKLFRENGYLSITTADIAKAADLSTGTVYAYFKDKKDILIELLDSSMVVFKEEISKELEKCSNTDDILTTIKNVLYICVKFHKDFPQKYHDEIMSLSCIDKDVMKYFNYNKNIIMGAVMNKLKKCGFELKEEKEQSFLIYSLIMKIEDQLVFDIDPELNKDVLIDKCAHAILAIIS